MSSQSEPNALWEFHKYEECRLFIEHNLKLDPNQPVLSQALLDAFTASSLRRDDSRSTAKLRLRLNKWVIRNNDLEIFDLTRNALVSLAAVNFVVQNLTQSSLTALFLSLLKLFKTIYARGAKLSHNQIQVIYALEHFRGHLASENKILGFLNANDNSIWTKKHLRTVLCSLMEIPTREGLVSLVQKNENNMWILRDV